MRRCGGSADSLFTGGAQTAIHTATDGIPRLINQLCDHVLMLAALGGQRQVDSGGIEEAWADLQQLPVPLHDSPAATRSPKATSGIVEFGRLGEAAAVEPAKTVCDGALAQLAAIDQGLHVLQEDAADGSGELPGDEFSPASESNTEVELIFHSAHDPFGGLWEQEEVVIDRYASLEDAAVRSRHATSDSARALGAAVSAAVREAEEEAPVTIVANTGTELPADVLPETAASVDFHPASDPLLPEATPVALPPRRATISLRDLGPDDRDLIVVEDEQPQVPAPPTARQRRPEYRQLFSSLRNK
jgi:hypothetical protein